MALRMNVVPTDGVLGRMTTPGLQKAISPIQFAIFGFGSVVGTAWVVLLGGWLLRAGPIGAMLGVVLAGAAMALIAAMYAELAPRFPQTGGEVTYISAVFGKQSGFIVGWRSEEHTPELQSLMRSSYAVFCLKKKKNT